MTRIDFMNQLENLLSNISESERMEALDYYNSYFDDAGEENESRVIRELGSPGKVAAIIKADLAGDGGEYAEYTETGYQDSRTRAGEVPDVYQRVDEQGSGAKYHYHEATGGGAHSSDRSGRGYQAPVKKNHIGNLILIIIIAVVSSVIWLPILGGILAMLAGLIAAAVGLLIALVATGITGVIAGVYAIIKGILQCITVPGLGLMEIAGGLFVLAIGILCVWLMILIVGQFLPWAIRKITNGCQRLLHRGNHKKEGGAEV